MKKDEVAITHIKRTIGILLSLLCLILQGCPTDSGCRSDGECDGSRVCRFGVCASPTGTGCRSDGECGGARVCRFGVCVSQTPETPGVQTSQVNLSSPTSAHLSPQEQSQWCWAATISNVFAFHGHPVSQARIVSEVYGLPANFRSGAYSNISALLNRTWIDDNGVPFSSRVNGLFDVMAGVQTFNNNQIRQSLDSNEPLVVGTTTHATLLVSMSYTLQAGNVSSVQAVGVFDPWPGQGFRNLSVAEATPVYNGGTLMFVAWVSVSSAETQADAGTSPHDCDGQPWAGGDGRASVCPDGTCSIIGPGVPEFCTGSVAHCGSRSFRCPTTRGGWTGYCCGGSQFVPCLNGGIPCFAIGSCVRTAAECPVSNSIACVSLGGC